MKRRYRDSFDSLIFPLFCGETRPMFLRNIIKREERKSSRSGENKLHLTFLVFVQQRTCCSFVSLFLFASQMFPPRNERESQFYDTLRTDIDIFGLWSIELRSDPEILFFQPEYDVYAHTTSDKYFKLLLKKYLTIIKYRSIKR